jgi:hypothetical protein
VVVEVVEGEVVETEAMVEAAKGLCFCIHRLLLSTIRDDDKFHCILRER